LQKLKHQYRHRKAIAGTPGDDGKP